MVRFQSIAGLLLLVATVAGLWLLVLKLARRGDSTPVAPSAAVSLGFGVLGMVAPVVIASIAALVCGHVALGRIKRSDGSLGGCGLAVTGIVLGWVGLAFTALVILVIALAMSNP
jgi:Domain of unknown function (DUF4190)